MTAVTLTAGNAFNVEFGYSRPGSSLSFAFGTLSAQPLAGQTIDALATGSIGNMLALAGNTTGLGPLTLTVNGAPWTLSAGVYTTSPNVTTYTLSGFGAGFVDGVAYTVDLTAGSGPPTIDTTRFFPFF